MHVFFSSSAQCLPLSAQSDYSYSQRLLTAENGQNSGFGQERRAQQTVWRSAIIFTYWVRTQDCPGGRQASELLAVPVGRSPARIAPTGRISAFPFSDVFLSQVVVSSHLFGPYYLIKRPDNYIILCIRDSPEPFRRPAATTEMRTVLWCGEGVCDDGAIFWSDPKSKTKQSVPTLLAQT